MAAQLMPLLLAGGNDPPWVRDLAKAIGAREDTVRELLRKQARLGALYQVVKDLFYPAERIAELASTSRAERRVAHRASGPGRTVRAHSHFHSRFSPRSPPPFGLSPPAALGRAAHRPPPRAPSKPATSATPQLSAYASAPSRSWNSSTAWATPAASAIRTCRARIPAGARRDSENEDISPAL